ncbi:MAG TPA: response regulator [Bryobacteraceae bacterium]|nr:response regulator [Bryobacteraceae bacterium]
MNSGFIPHGYCMQWDTPLIVIYVITDALVALSYYSIPAALFFLAFKRRQSVPLQPLLILFGLFIAFCGGGHAIDIVSLWKPVYWLKGLWNIGTAVTSVITAIALVPQVMEFVRMPETAARLRREKSDLEEQQSLIRAVLDSTDDGMVLVGEDGSTLLYNAAAQRVLGSGIPSVDWPQHRAQDQDTVRLPNGRLVERLTRPVSGYGQLYVVRDITERRMLEEQRLRLERVIQTMKQGFAIVAGDSASIVTTNPSFDAMYGGRPGELLGRPFESLLTGDEGERREVHEQIRRQIFREGYWEGETVNQRGDGTAFVAQCRINLHSQGESKLFSVIQTDITEQKKREEESRKLEQKMLQTAKLESVGLLAGGIAHDFNNLLTGILGNASLAYEQLSPSSPLRGRLHDVISASQRAADLTRQLLAYAGKGRFLMEPVEVNGLIREISNLVRMSIPRNVDVELALGEAAQVEADAAQIQQLLMNLIINGAEAIGEDRSGRVVVSTSAERLSPAGQSEALTDPLPPGRYSVIEVRDNGCGMSAETLAQIFDPFFTTKFTGRGLGLAAAIGIARGHRGSIQVRSTPGAGSTFRILLPVIHSTVPQRLPERTELSGEHTTGTVLIIDDEPSVRSTATAALEYHGYRVLNAESGARGVDIFEERSADISVVLLDLTMPSMSGEETLRLLRKIRPGVRVILSSGFNETEAMRRFADIQLAGFLQKPYTSGELIESVRAALVES